MQTGICAIKRWAVIDGYVNKRIECKAMDVKTGNIINRDIEMQDLLPNFFERPDVY